jgi:hypothetical protein
MENNLEVLFNNVVECKNRQSFELSDIKICQNRVELLKKAVPKDYVYYKQLMKAVDSTQFRFQIKEKLLSNKINETEDSIVSLNLRQMLLSKQENALWRTYYEAIKTKEVVVKPIVKSEQSPLIGVGYVFLLFTFGFFCYIAAKGVFSKMVYSQKLKVLGLSDYARLIDKDVFQSFNVKQYEKNKWVIMKGKEIESKTDNKLNKLDANDIKILFAVYKNIWAIEVAYLALKSEPERNEYEKLQKSAKISKLIADFEEKVKKQMEKGV